MSEHRKKSKARRNKNKEAFVMSKEPVDKVTLTQILGKIKKRPSTSNIYIWKSSNIEDRTELYLGPGNKDPGDIKFKTEYYLGPVVLGGDTYIIHKDAVDRK